MKDITEIDKEIKCLEEYHKEFENSKNDWARENAYRHKKMAEWLKDYKRLLEKENKE